MEQLTRLPASLEHVRIKTLPSSAYYIADFISEEEELKLIQKIETAPKPRWKQLSHRRLQTWPSDLHGGTTLLESPLPQWLTEPIVSRLLSCPVSNNCELGHIFSNSPHGAPNRKPDIPVLCGSNKWTGLARESDTLSARMIQHYVLVNEYLPGQGIMPHKDGSAYHSDLYGGKEDGAIEDEPRWRILQEPRSLLITTGKLYTQYLHGIKPVKEDLDLGPATISNFDLLRSPEDTMAGEIRREHRLSLTFRDVIKTSKLSSRIFGKH